MNYYNVADAAKAIATLNGFGYDHLILSVEWAKPSTNWALAFCRLLQGAGLGLSAFVFVPLNIDWI